VVAAAVVLSPTVRDEVPSAALTDATGTGVTVIAALAVFPSLAAVICAVPGDSAVTRPVIDTVATAGLLELQAIDLPVRTLLLASLVSTESGWALPSANLALEGATLTTATGTGATVTVALPLFPSLVPTIRAEPGARVETRPVIDTVATASLSELQLTTRSLSAPPEASNVAALACVVSPTMSERAATETDTEPTGIGVIVITADPLFPSLVAAISALPTPTAVTIPVGETEATAGLVDVQTIGRPVRTLPLPASSVAVAVVFPPTVRDVALSATPTDAIGIAVTDSSVLPDRPSLVAVM